MVDVKGAAVYCLTYNLFQDAAADARHADAERKLVAKSSTKLHHLQLGRVTGSLQSHSQQSANTCRTKNRFSTVLAATIAHSKTEMLDLHNLIN